MKKEYTTRASAPMMTMQLTPQLRYRVENKEKILQQAHLLSNGNLVWYDVPTNDDV